MSEEYADPNCPDCDGLGFIYGASMLDGGHACHCMMDALRLINMEKIWKALKTAREIPRLREHPPLKAFLKHNVWITAKDAVFKAHLKAVAFTQHTLWDARVVSDMDLVETWLKTAKAQGHKIYDSEIDGHKSRFVAMDIAELVEPPELVIIKLGVKQAPNKETHSVLLEAVSTRKHLGKPVWIVDQPDQRIDHIAHRGYSEVLEGILSHWPHLGLAGAQVKNLGGPAVDGEEEKLEMVSDMSVDDLLDTPEEASSQIDAVIENLEEGEGEGEGEGAEEGEEEGAEEGEEEGAEEGEEEGAEEEEEEDEEPAGLLATLNIEPEEKKFKRKSSWKKKSRSWKK